MSHSGLAGSGLDYGFTPLQRGFQVIKSFTNLNRNTAIQYKSSILVYINLEHSAGLDYMNSIFFYCKVI
jgi:hypothetical protein